MNSTLEVAFKFAVHQINRDSSLLPHTQVTYDIQYVPHDNSFHTIKTGLLLSSGQRNDILTDDSILHAKYVFADSMQPTGSWHFGSIRADRRPPGVSCALHVRHSEFTAHRS